MVGELVMLPVRVGVRVTRLWFRALEETVSVTTSATGRVVGLLASRSPNGAGGEPPVAMTQHEDAMNAGEDAMTQREDAITAPGRPSDSKPRSAAAQKTSVSDLRSATEMEPPAPPPTVKPDHVSEEPVLVEEFAEPGAEQGAGAQVRVDPPWDGYARMGAKEVVTRLATADAAELAAVQLFEASHRRRRTVMNEVERELRRANTRRSRTNHRR